MAETIYPSFRTMRGYGAKKPVPLNPHRCIAFVRNPSIHGGIKKQCMNDKAIGDCCRKHASRLPTPITQEAEQ